MKQAFTLLALVFVTVCAFAQQEELTPLSYNPRQYNDTRQFNTPKHKYLIEKGTIVVATDTLSLPFVDDFSSNRLRGYKWLENNITDTVYNVLSTCLGPEQITAVTDTFSTDTAWTYTFDTVNKRLDSTALPPIEFKFYGITTSNCFASAPSTQYYWPKYYTYTFDSATGRPIDSVPTSTNTALSEILNYAPVIYFAAAEPGTLWFDNYAYINNTYPILPPTIGVATLDGLNEFGFPYNNSTKFTYGDADKLTSKPINLSGITAADSVYISFFYEGDGLGEPPSSQDSLILEFRDVSGQWYYAWSTPGYSAVNPAPQQFKQVLIKLPELSVTNSLFHPTFQFRFRNKASLYGNLDHWHIDYVKLDRNRSEVDTVLRDIAFIYRFPNLLKNYTQMPADQFTGASDLIDTINLVVHNLDPAADNNPPATNFAKSASELYPSPVVIANEVIQTFNAGSYNTIQILPGSEYNIPTTPIWPVDSLVLQAKVSIDPNDTRPQNDTLTYTQYFSNVMAYDDGSAESAYGLTGTQPKRFAYEFNLNQPDTLAALQIMYAQVDDNVSNLVFNIYVWDSIKLNDFAFTDAPVVTLDNKKPYYVDSTNGFTTYKLDTPIVFPSKLYIGWGQNETEPRSLQIGYDLNSTLGRQHMFVYRNGRWQASTITPGSPMIRAIFTSNYRGGATGVTNLTHAAQLKVFPNPSTGYIYLLGNNNAMYDAAITTLTGQQVLFASNVTDGINISHLSDGVYLLAVRNTATGTIHYHKIIKSSY